MLVWCIAAQLSDRLDRSSLLPLIASFLDFFFLISGFLVGNFRLGLLRRLLPGMRRSLRFVALQLMYNTCNSSRQLATAARGLGAAEVAFVRTRLLIFLIFLVSNVVSQRVLGLCHSLSTAV